MVTLPARKNSARRNETRDLTKPIESALNAMPGVWAARNTVGVGYHRNGDPATWGLGTGSADIIFSVGCIEIARIGWLEVKQPGKKSSDAQRRWQAAMVNKRHFVAVVHSVEEAILAVIRCEIGETT
jgi:hypothetical protein